MQNEVASLLMRYFVQRRDVKAIQQDNGAYYPAREYRDGPYTPLTERDIQNHLDNRITYGHYLMDSANMCRVFAFDIDLDKTGFYPVHPELDGNQEVVPFSPMEHWRSRKPDAARVWMKMQFRHMAEILASTIVHELQIPALVAYSGSKGIHVYGLTGPVTGEQARMGIDIVLDKLDRFHPVRGVNFFKHNNSDPVLGFPNLTIEVFPKQERVDNKEKGVGNLMRLPLGRNRKTTDPTFFVDCSKPMSELTPLDPLVALKTLNPWGKLPKRVGGDA